MQNAMVNSTRGRLLRTYPLSLSATYLKHWSVVDGVREMLQNALDHGGLGNTTWGMGEEEGTGYMVVGTPDIQLHPSVLLLGNGTKSEDCGKLGGFGEGLKVALLILARNGLTVRIINGDKIWIPEFKEDPDFGAKMLHIEEYENLSEPVGLSIEIECLSQTELDSIISRTLHLQGALSPENIISTTKGDILQEEQFSGKVFVGGLYICDSGMKNGYNFKPETVKLNRDRQTLSNWDMKTLTERMWLEEGSPEVVVSMCLDKVDDISHLQYEYSYPEDVTEEALKTHIKLHGDVPIADTKSQLDMMIKDGYTDTAFIGNENFSNLVRAAKSYKEVPKEIVKTPKEILKEFASDWFEDSDQTIRAPLEAVEDLIQLSEGWRA